ncbi:hypothetical protein ACIUZH_18350 [Pseudomonas aeruginosa]
MNKANECTCPSGNGSLRHPCPAHPAVEQAGGDERDFQAEGAQEVPSPVSQEYDRHLISLLRKGEALPGHQEEAADEIERLRDWNDHLNNTVLPNILNPTFLMLMKGGERLLDLCTKDGEFIGVSLNDMKDVFDWMVTHARIAPDQAALAQPTPAGEYGDAYQGAREDIAIWKRRALEAEQALRQAHNGQTFMGEPLVQPYEAPREKVNALFKVLGFSGTASVGDILDAALERLQAQPSPALPPFAEKVLAKLRRFYDCASDFESGGVDIGRHWLDLLTQLGLLNRVQRSPALWEISQQGEDLLGMPQPSPAQAEAERPEVVAVMESNGAGGKRLAQRFPIVNVFVGDELMTVAQHERIVGELRAVIAQLRQHKNDYMDSGQETYRALQNEIREREAEIARLDGLVSGRTAERDAALARVAELERELRDEENAHITTIEQRDNAEHWADQLAKAIAERFGVDIGEHSNLNCPWNEALVWMQQPPTQAQHSVPEEFSFEYRHPNGESHTVTVSRDQVINEMPDFLFEALCSKLCNCEPAGETNVVECCCDEYAEEFKLLAAAPVCRLSRNALTDAQMRRLYENSTETENERLGFAAFARLIRRAEAVHQIAAAPGKEVPQAWLDVQAERRRQITAEGWTPEHDDLYCAAELPRAAAAYILNGANDEAPAIWPFSAKWWKPRDARSNYVRASALILAEIERLDRAAPGKEGNDD